MQKVEKRWRRILVRKIPRDIDTPKKDFRQSVFETTAAFGNKNKGNAKQKQLGDRVPLVNTFRSLEARHRS